MVADAVAIEPVSGTEIPENWEIYWELPQPAASIMAILVPEPPLTSGSLWSIPGQINGETYASNWQLTCCRAFRSICVKHT